MSKQEIVLKNLKALKVKVAKINSNCLDTLKYLNRLNDPNEARKYTAAHLKDQEKTKMLLLEELFRQAQRLLDFSIKLEQAVRNNPVPDHGRKAENQKNTREIIDVLNSAVATMKIIETIDKTPVKKADLAPTARPVKHHATLDKDALIKDEMHSAVAKLVKNVKQTARVVKDAQIGTILDLYAKPKTLQQEYIDYKTGKKDKGFFVTAFNSVLHRSSPVNEERIKEAKIIADDLRFINERAAKAGADEPTVAMLVRECLLEHKSSLSLNSDLRRVITDLLNKPAIKNVINDEAFYADSALYAQWGKRNILPSKGGAFVEKQAPNSH